MEIKKYLFMVIVAFLIAPATATQGDAGQEIAFMEIGYGAKAMALGSAYVANSSPDASSLYWNPASLAFLEKKELATMQNSLSTDAAYFYLGGVFPSHLLNWGFSWVQLQLADIPQTSPSLNNNEVSVLNNLTYYANGITLGGGHKISDQLAIGFSIKYFEKKISEQLGNGRGQAFSLGLIYLINDQITLGLYGDNLSNLQIYDTGTTEIVPAKYNLGLAYKINSRLRLLLSTEKRSDTNSISKGHVGFEYSPNPNLYFALGQNYNQFTAGAGFRINGISADYAYIAENNLSLGAEHFVTLGLKW